jgi:hypothetical protein
VMKRSKDRWEEVSRHRIERQGRERYGEGMYIREGPEEPRL